MTFILCFSGLAFGCGEENENGFEDDLSKNDANRSWCHESSSRKGQWTDQI